MSIEQRLVYIPVCDGCKGQIEDSDGYLPSYYDEEGAREYVRDHEGKATATKVLCSSCWEAVECALCGDLDCGEDFVVDGEAIARCARCREVLAS